MNIAARAVELPQRLAWKRGQLLSATLYRRAFRSWGAGSVMVNPLKIQGAERISLGAHCAIFDGAWLGAETSGDLVIGDHVYLGHGVHVHAVDEVRIGARSMIADHAFISAGGHDMAADAAPVSSGPIRIGERVFVGQAAMVLGGVTIGDDAVIGAGSVVTRDVPAGAVVAGVPARPLPRAATAASTDHEEIRA
ncbi:acyltransferase [Kytococcus sedentarius]|uniref:acyltransferase n=1 Tax=Kytococcus sedentarius TaxID=1276 RepID=UPI00194DB751|nr:acyltransferase [Kytococcus sedentarius]QRO87438.1 acyltransferase [Kytococcus sedentarius]